jgi:hypothetical protein
VIVNYEYALHGSRLLQDQVAGDAGVPPSFSQRAFSALAAACLAVSFALLEAAHVRTTSMAAAPSTSSDPNNVDVFDLVFMDAESHAPRVVVISTVHRQL